MTEPKVCGPYLSFQGAGLWLDIVKWGPSMKRDSHPPDLLVGMQLNPTDSMIGRNIVSVIGREATTKAKASALSL